MKIAVITDIHANYRALETVIDHIERWNPDHVIVAGDIVNRGPRSECCKQIIEEKRHNEGWKVIRGNHEDYVIERDDPDDPKSGVLFDMYQPVHFAYHQLNQDTSFLRALPNRISLEFINLGTIRVCHASMLGNRVGIYPEDTDNKINKKIYPPPTVFIAGHTHRSLIHRINSTLIVNAGSVGLPFDGDTRAAYAQIIYHKGQWLAEIIRLDYNLQLAEKDFNDFGFFEGGGPLVDIILLELRTGFGQLFQWVSKYFSPIKNGEITVADATKKFLRNPVTKPYWEIQN
jgi:putative phosphoesterase